MSQGQQGTAPTEPGKDRYKRKNKNGRLPVGEITPEGQRREPRQFMSHAFIQLRPSGDISRNHQLAVIKAGASKEAKGAREALEAPHTGSMLHWRD